MQQFTRLFLNNIYFILLYMAALVCFQLNYFAILFFILFLLFIIVAFLKESQRVFVWMTIAYFLGELVLLYANRFLNELNLYTQMVFIVEKLLLLFPIIFILYVSNKFNQHITFIVKESFLKNPISKLHDLSRGKRLTFLILIFLSVALSLSLLAFQHFPFSFIGHLLLFISISSIIEEILWRGLLMQAMKNLTNKWAALILSSISYGCSYLMYGYSIGICTVFALSGLLYGWLTLYFRNLFPAICCHLSILLIMIVSRTVPFTLL